MSTATASTKAAANSTAATGRKQERSPNFPVTNFSVAMGCARKIWEREKRNPVGVELALSHMGYKVNGKSRQLLSTLKKYGLLIQQGSDVRISEEGNKLFVYPASAPERQELVRSLAMRPSVFQAIRKKFPERLPSDENLVARLQLEMGFTGSAAKTCIKVLRDAMATAGTEVEQDTPDGEPPPGDRPAAPPPGSRAAPPVPQGESTGGGRATHETHSWKLGAGVWAEIKITGKLGTKELTKLVKYVELLDADNEDEADGEE